MRDRMEMKMKIETDTVVRDLVNERRKSGTCVTTHTYTLEISISDRFLSGT